MLFHVIERALYLCDEQPILRASVTDEDLLAVTTSYRRCITKSPDTFGWMFGLMVQLVAAATIKMNLDPHSILMYNQH